MLWREILLTSIMPSIWLVFMIIWDWPIIGSPMMGSVWQVKFSPRESRPPVGERILKWPGDRPGWRSFEI